MKHIRKIAAIGLCAGLSLSVWAQTQKKTEEKKEAKPKVKPIPAYLGKSSLDGGDIEKQVFDSLLRQGISSRDSAGRPYKVLGFAFSYGERNLYEDSVGRLMMLTDYLTEYCYGDTLSTFLVNNITDRSKGGDTVYVDQITVLSPEGKGALGKSMRFVIKKH